MTTRQPLLAARATLLGMMIFTIAPLATMLMTALHPRGEPPMGIAWPDELHWHNFIDAWNVSNAGALMQSSILIVVVVLPCAVVFATCAGYGIGHLRIAAAEPLLLIFLAGLVIPLEGLVVPLYYFTRELHILNTRWAIILPMIGLSMPFGVFWMQSHFRGMPVEMAEAAAVDGAGPFNILYRVFLPLSWPAMSTLAILIFLNTWNQFILALVLVDGPTRRTMAGALGAFQGQYNTDIVLLSAGALVIIAPTILVYLVLQRYFIRALFAGAVKG